MVISPAVPAPKPGDPITAKWASDLAAAVNSCANPADRVGEVSTPFGKASPAPGLPMLGAAARMPQPFDVALFRDEGESADTLYIWLPDLGADYVVYKGKPLPAAPGQTIGDANTAWVEIGSIASGAAHYIYLVPHKSSGGTIDGWEIADTATAWSPSGGGTGTGDEPPHVLLAYYNIAADGSVPAAGTDDKFPSGQNGLVQCRHGTIVFGGDSCQDSYGLDCAETGGTGTEATLDITLTRTPCDGEPENVDTCSVPLLTGDFISSLDGFYVQGSYLYLSYTVSEIVRGRKTGTHNATVACPVTTCED